MEAVKAVPASGSGDSFGLSGSGPDTCADLPSVFLRFLGSQEGIQFELSQRFRISDFANRPLGLLCPQPAQERFRRGIAGVQNRSLVR